jgi:hypothetical protein
MTMTHQRIDFRSLVATIAAMAMAHFGCDESSTRSGTGATTVADQSAAAPSQASSTPSVGAKQQSPAIESNPSGAKQLSVRVDAPKPTEFNLGDVDPHSKHQITVSLTNPTSSAATIDRAVPDCACTTTEPLDGRTIGPGETIVFPVNFAARSEPGEKHAKLNIVIDGGRYRPVIQIAANIVMPIMGQPPYVDALENKTSGTVEIYSRDNQPFRIVSSNGAAPQLVGQSGGGTPSNRYTLAWDVSPFAGPGMKLWWIVETDRPDCPILPLRIRHEWSGGKADPDRRARGWIMKEYLINAASIAPGKPVELEAVLTNPNRQRITSVESLSSDAAISLISQQDVGEQESLVKLRFTPREGFAGLMYAMARFNSPTGHADCAVVAQVK